MLAAGTKIEQDVENNKPIAVSVVTLLVDPCEAERLTLASTEGKIQLALRNPLDKTMPADARHPAGGAAGLSGRPGDLWLRSRVAARSATADQRWKSFVATNARRKSCARSSRHAHGGDASSCVRVHRPEF